MITISTYGTISEAYIFKNILDLEGVESFVSDSNVMVDNPVLNTTEGTVRLSVRESDAARAISVLNRQREKENQMK